MSSSLPIIHLYQYVGDISNETRRRNALAAQSWEKVYSGGNWKVRFLDDNILIRTTNHNILGESKNLPYLRDILNFGTLGCADDQLIVFTNSDTCVSPDFVPPLLGHAHRRDFNRLEIPLEGHEIPKGSHYPGSDLFTFTADWWRKNRSNYPDLCCAETWDKILRELIKLSGGVEIKDMIYHEKHDSWWEVNRNSPCNKYNRRLSRKWLKARSLPLGELDFHEIL